MRSYHRLFIFSALIYNTINVNANSIDGKYDISRHRALSSVFAHVSKPENEITGLSSIYDEMEADDDDWNSSDDDRHNDDQKEYNTSTSSPLPLPSSMSSSIPSSSQNDIPSHTPTTALSDLPSLQPSPSPSITHSSDPTMIPSEIPSKAPSDIMSANTSISPVNPTGKPVASSLRAMSITPTFKPSVAPGAVANLAIVTTENPTGLVGTVLPIYARVTIELVAPIGGVISQMSYYSTVNIFQDAVSRWLRDLVVEIELVSISTSILEGVVNLRRKLQEKDSVFIELAIDGTASFSNLATVDVDFQQGYAPLYFQSFVNLNFEKNSDLLVRRLKSIAKESPEQSTYYFNRIDEIKYHPGEYPNNLITNPDGDEGNITSRISLTSIIVAGCASAGAIFLLVLAVFGFISRGRNRAIEEDFNTESRYEKEVSPDTYLGSNTPQPWDYGNSQMIPASVADQRYINDDHLSRHIKDGNASASGRSYYTRDQLYTAEKSDAASNQSYGFSLEDGIGSKQTGSSGPAEAERPSPMDVDTSGLEGMARYTFAEHDNSTIEVSFRPVTKISGITDLGPHANIETRGRRGRELINAKKTSIISMLSGFTEGSRAPISAKKPSNNSKSTFSGLSDPGTQASFEAGGRDSRELRGGKRISSNSKSPDKKSRILPALTQKTTKSYQRDCVAPPGKLGVVLNTTKYGPVVHVVKKGSPLEHSIFPGDRILSIDNIDTRNMTASGVTQIMGKKIHHERSITVSSIQKPQFIIPFNER